MNAYDNYAKYLYNRYLRQLKVRILGGRESDRRNPQDVLTWTRDRSKRKGTIMRTVTKVAVLAWTLWSLQGNQLKQIEAVFTSQDACIEASFRLAYLRGVETRCMGDYSLTRGQ